VVKSEGEKKKEGKKRIRKRKPVANQYLSPLNGIQRPKILHEIQGLKNL
jgi:hypothetical protein